MPSKVLLLMILLVFSAACNSKQSIVDIKTPIPFSKPTETQVVAVSTSTFVPTQPSLNVEPTHAMQVATLDAVATTKAMQTDLISKIPQLADYNTFCGVDYCVGVEVSENGRWIYFSNGNVMELFRSDGQKVGEYSFYEIFGHRIDLRDGYLESIHWSKDGQYFYLATSFGDGGPEAYFGYKASLAQVNLENGTWNDTGISGVISFSPNEQYIVYSTADSELRVRDVKSGEEAVYFTPKEYLYFGNFVWSPDSNKVIFVAVPEELDIPQGTFALFVVDLVKQTLTKVYEASLPFYSPVTWSDDAQVLLRQYQGTETLILDLLMSPPVVYP